MIGRELVHVEDELDIHEAMLPLVLLLERAGSLECPDPKDLPIWQLLSSLESVAVSRRAIC